MTGKEKCRTLRAIRARIAEANELPWDEPPCTHSGPCAGTCPHCEQHLRRLETGLKRRAALGKRIALIGLCAGMAVGTAGCSMLEELDFQPDRTTGVPPTPTDMLLMGEIAPADGAWPEASPEGELPDNPDATASTQP